MSVYIIVSGYVMFTAPEEGSHMSLCTCNQIVLLWAQACEGQREHQAQPPSLMISIINNVMEQASKLIQIYAREMSANCPDVALIHMRPHSSAMLPGRFQQLICFLCKKRGNQSLLALSSIIRYVHVHTIYITNRFRSLLINHQINIIQCTYEKLCHGFKYIILPPSSLNTV